MIKTIVGSALVIGIFGLAATAQAAPAPSGMIGIERAAPGSVVEETNYRRHRRYGHRNHYGHSYGYRSHGNRYGYRHGYGNRYGYSQPGIYLNFGSGYGYGGRRHW